MKNFLKKNLCLSLVLIMGLSVANKLSGMKKPVLEGIENYDKIEGPEGLVGYKKKDFTGLDVIKGTTDADKFQNIINGFQAVNSCLEKMVDGSLENGKFDLLNLIDGKGKTLLHLLVSGGFTMPNLENKLKNVKFLISKSKDVDTESLSGAYYFEGTKFPFEGVPPLYVLLFHLVRTSVFRHTGKTFEEYENADGANKFTIKRVNVFLSIIKSFVKHGAKLKDSLFKKKSPNVLMLSQTDRDWLIKTFKFIKDNA